MQNRSRLIEMSSFYFDLHSDDRSALEFYDFLSANFRLRSKEEDGSEVHKLCGDWGGHLASSSPNYSQMTT